MSVVKLPPIGTGVALVLALAGGFGIPAAYLIGGALGATPVIGAYAGALARRAATPGTCRW